MLKLLKSSVSAVILSSVLMSGALAAESQEDRHPDAGGRHRLTAGTSRASTPPRRRARKTASKWSCAQGLGYGDVRPTLRELADDGASLMIAHASGYNTAAPEIAEETKVPVAIVDTPTALASPASSPTTR